MKAREAGLHGPFLARASYLAGQRAPGGDLRQGASEQASQITFDWFAGRGQLPRYVLACDFSSVRTCSTWRRPRTWQFTLADLHAPRRGVRHSLGVAGPGLCWQPGARQRSRRRELMGGLHDALGRRLDYKGPRSGRRLLVRLLVLPVRRRYRHLRAARRLPRPSLNNAPREDGPTLAAGFTSCSRFSTPGARRETAMSTNWPPFPYINGAPVRRPPPHRPRFDDGDAQNAPRPPACSTGRGSLPLSSARCSKSSCDKGYAAPAGRALHACRARYPKG